MNGNFNGKENEKTVEIIRGDNSMKQGKTEQRIKRKMTQKIMKKITE